MVEHEAKRLDVSALFWGRFAQLKLSIRIVVLVFVAASISSMSFSQLGFWPIGVVDGKSVYLMLLLAPLAMGAFMFGPFTGALLGLFSGFIVFTHAQFFPLDFYEVYFMSPLNTFVLLTGVGALLGWLFSFALRRNPKRAVRLGVIALICVFVSVAASVLVLVNTVIAYSGIESFENIREYLFNSPKGLAVQGLIDASLMTLLCCLADVGMRKVLVRDRDRSLRSMFSNWMLIVSAIAFMVTNSIIFTTTSAVALDIADKQMQSKVAYLRNQLLSNDDVNVDRLLEGFDVVLDGWTVITDEDGIIVATNSASRFPKGDSFVADMGYGDGTPESGLPAKEFFEGIMEGGFMAELQATGEDGSQTMDIVFVSVSDFGRGYAALVRTPEMVYANRFDTMVATTLLAAVLLAVVAVVATVLLRRVVAARIDETNQSLAKISAGNLDVRLGMYDSREFTSLSTGINAMVSALKETINEVEQRNAQDLATAKIIQESTLPREFPPFPQIDKFDVYASMKMAKEVGGDFYDFFLVGDDEDKLCFVVADVSGKGIPAALFMMAAKTQIHNYVEAGLPLDEAVNAANHQLCIGNDMGMFVTMWIALLEYQTGQLTYVNAGHNPPLLLSDGSWEWMREVSGMPLGLFDGIPYKAQTRQLRVGEMLYLYTDGVTEAMDADGQLFSEQRLEETLYTYADMNPRSVGVGVRRAITEFTRDANQSDDITMLIMKYGVPPIRKAVMVLRAEDDQLIHVCNFIHEELRRRNAPKSVYNPLDIAAEEFFINVCHYAYPDATPENPGEVRISFEYDGNPPTLTVQISDDGVPYDPTKKPDAVTPDDIADVPIGGLGILMAKRSVDSLSYERVGDSNVVTFVKGW